MQPINFEESMVKSFNFGVLRNINTSQFEKVFRINQIYSEHNYAAIEQKESFKLGVQLCKSQWNKMKIQLNTQNKNETLIFFQSNPISKPKYQKIKKIK